MHIKTFFFLFIFSTCIFSQETKFYSAHFPPYSFEFETKRGGAIYDVAQEIIKRLNLNLKIEFISWPRARLEAESKNNIFLIPLARTPDREEKYSWIIHVLDDPYVMIALKKSSFNISNHESAKKLKIGVLKKSVADQMLRDLGYQNLEESTSDVRNISKLKLGRLDAWVAPLSAINQYKKEAGIGIDQLRVGLELTVLHEYIGASRSLDINTQKLWQDVFNNMKKDGTYKAIMKKYNLKPLP